MRTNPIPPLHHGTNDDDEQCHDINVELDGNISIDHENKSSDHKDNELSSSSSSPLSTKHIHIDKDKIWAFHSSCSTTQTNNQINGVDLSTTHNTTMANNSSTTNNPKKKIDPEIYTSSKFGRVYLIDLTEAPLEDADSDLCPNIDSGTMYKQIKQSHECQDGESSTRYVYKLGCLKMMKTTSDNKNKSGKIHNNGNFLKSNNEDSKILCLHRHKVWWMRPVFLDCDTQKGGVIVPPETIFLLGLDDEDDIFLDVNEDNGDDKDHGIAGNKKEAEKVYRLVLPLILPDGNGCTSCSLRSSLTNINDIELHSETGGIVAFYCGIGTDPFQLIEDGVEMAASLSTKFSRPFDDLENNVPIITSSLLSSATIKSKYTSSSFGKRRHVLPPFASKLGYCTWNAFYTQLNGEKIISAAKTLQERDVPIKWMIIDDGWQHTTNDSANNGMQWGERLLSVNRASPVKFASEDDTEKVVIEKTASSPHEQKMLSLKETVTKLKEPKRLEIELNDPHSAHDQGIGLDAVLAWHTLPGYWLGLSNKVENADYDGPPTTLYYPHFSSNMIECDTSVTREKSIVKGIGIANNGILFYDQYHSFLQTCGFDGVKVDAQGVCGFLRPYPTVSARNCEYEYTQNEPHRHHVSYHLQDALASSIIERFSSQCNMKSNRADDIVEESSVSRNIIMCMCHSLDIIYRLPHLYSKTKPLMRASDDFYPENDNCHGPHLVACAFNSLLLGSLAVPDWDMFTTESTITGEMHAMARAISGGPVYFSDKPLEADQSIIERLACKNGMILTCCDYVRPTRNSLLNDPLSKDGYPLILWNVNGYSNNESEITSGVLAVFHLASSGKWCYDSLDFIQSPDFDKVDSIKTITISPLNVEAFRRKIYQNVSFVVMSSQLGMLGIVRVDDSFDVKVKYLQSSIIHLIPIHELSGYVDFVVLGILNLYNSAGAVKGVKYELVGGGSYNSNTYKNNSTNHDKKKISIVIDTFGCGHFFLGYKFKDSFEPSRINVHFNGKKSQNFLINDDTLEPTNENASIDDKILSSIRKKGFCVHCVDLPFHHDFEVGKLEIVIE